MSNLKSTAGASEKEMLQLQEEVDDLKVWKQKYETLRNNAAAFKERYEGRLAEVEQQRDELEEALQRAQVERDRAQDAGRKAGASGGQSGTDRDAVTAEVKKVMNSVYQELRVQFSPDQKYSGKEVQGAILNTVKSVTLKMVQGPESEERAEEPEVMVSQSAAQTSSAPPPKECKKESAEKAPITGDKGNPYYAEELKKAAEKIKSTISPSTANVTGDKGNPYYAAELTGEDPKVKAKEGGKPTPNPSEAAILASVESLIIPGGEPSPPKKKDGEKKKPNASEAAILASVQACIIPNTSSSLGSKPPAKEEHTDKKVKASEAAILSSVEACIVPGTTSSLGSKPPPKDEPNALKANTTAGAIFASVGAMVPPAQMDSKDESSQGEKTNRTGEAMMAAVEECLVPDVASGTGAIPKKPKSSNKKGTEEKAGKATSAAIFESVEAMMMPLGSGNKSDEKSKPESSKPKQGPIKPATAHTTGDKGNPHYAKELEKDPSKTAAAIFASVESCIIPDGVETKPSKVNKDKKAESGKAGSIEPKKAHITGDKGNVHYAEELDKAAKSVGNVEAEIIAPQSAGMTSSAPPASSPPAKESKEKAHPTGDKGNPNYAHELDKAGAKTGKPSGAPIDPKKAPITGDKGNVHYGKELDKAAVPDVIAPQSVGLTSSAPPRKAEAEVITAATATSTSAAPVKPGPESKDKAHITGDKGNPYYAEELKKGASDKERQLPKESPEKANITGDKGNVHYAEELKHGDDKKKDSEKKSEKKTSTPKDIPPDILSAIEKQVIPGLEAAASKADKKDEKKIAEKVEDLFGGDDDPLFSTPTSKKAKKAKDAKKSPEKETKSQTKDQKKEQGDSDDSLKPKPPPLFGDDDDDDDLDWLS